MVAIDRDAEGVVISPELAYDTAALKRMGFGQAAIRQMRRRGLPVHRSGRRSFVFGSDLLHEIRQNGRVLPPVAGRGKRSCSEPAST